MHFNGRGVARVVISAKVLNADGSLKKDLGDVSVWDKNPLKRLLWRVKRWLR